MTTTAKPRTRVKSFQERSSAAGSHLEVSEGIVTNVAILGQNSTNGRYYTETALDEAVGQYNGVPVNLDHADTEGNRSVLSKVGVITGARKVKEDGGYRVRGDVKLYKNHVHAPFVSELIQDNAAGVGFSHVVQGTSEEADDGTERVTGVKKVLSVDIVQNPATNRSFSESTEQSAMSQLKSFAADLDEEHELKQCLLSFAEQCEAETLGPAEVLAAMELADKEAKQIHEQAGKDDDEDEDDEEPVGEVPADMDAEPEDPGPDVAADIDVQADIDAIAGDAPADDPTEAPIMDPNAATPQPVDASVDAVKASVESLAAALDSLKMQLQELQLLEQARGILAENGVTPKPALLRELCETKDPEVMQESVDAWSLRKRHGERRPDLPLHESTDESFEASKSYEEFIGNFK